MPEDVKKAQARKARHYEKKKQEEGFNDKRAEYMRQYRAKKKQEAILAKQKADEQAKKPSSAPKPKSFQNLRDVVAKVKAKREASKPQKKLNEIEVVAGRKLAGVMRSKLEANIMQPAIFSDLYGSKLIKQNIESQLPDIPELMNIGMKQAPPPPPSAPKKARGRPRKQETKTVPAEPAVKRPRGRPRKQPLTTTETNMENIIVNKL